MASTASKRAFDTVSAIGHTVVAHLRTARTYHCDIPNYKDDKPLRLYVDETQYGSGLWKVREMKDQGYVYQSYEKANIFDAFRYVDTPLISDPITTSQLLYMLDDMIDENRNHLTEAYIASYEQNIQKKLLDIVNTERFRMNVQHPANEP